MNRTTAWHEEPALLQRYGMLMRAMAELDGWGRGLKMDMKTDAHQQPLHGCRGAPRQWRS